MLTFLLWPGGPSTTSGHGGRLCSWATGLGVGVGFGVGGGVGWGVGFGVATGPGVGVAFGGGVAPGGGVGAMVGVGPVVGAAVGRVTGLPVGLGVGRTAIPPPDGAAVAEADSVGPTDGSPEAPSEGAIEGSVVPLGWLEPSADGVTTPGVDEPTAMPPEGNSGAPMPTAKANAARTRFSTPRATTRRAR